MDLLESSLNYCTHHYLQGEHACYLFNCGEPSKCNFSAHDGFTSIGLTGGIKHDQMVSASKNQHAQDLADLAAKSTTTSTSTTTTSTTPVPTKLKKQPGTYKLAI